MPTIHTLRWQHAQVSQLMLRLIDFIKAHRPGDNAYPITLQLAQWVSLLRGHLACEDAWFYPAMIASGDAKAVAKASELRADMGHLAERLEAFDRRWSSSAVIGVDFPRFHHEAFALFAAFDRRISREDQALYPLAERKGIGARPNAA